MHIIYKILLAVLVFFVGCALPPDDSSRQDFVPEAELYSLRLVAKGMQEIQRGRYLQGEMSLRKALVLTPDAEKILLNIGAALYGQERYEEAYEYFSDLQKKDPLNPSIRLWMAKSLIGAGALSSAEFILEEGVRLIELDPDPKYIKNLAPAFLRSIANARYRNGDFDGAICASQQALNYAGNDQEFLKHLKLLMQTGRVQSAQWYSVNANPAGITGNSEFQLRKAEIEFLLGDINAAKITLQGLLARPMNDSLQAYELKLLTLAVGMELQKRGEQVDLAILNDSRLKADVLMDPRRAASALDAVLPE